MIFADLDVFGNITAVFNSPQDPILHPHNVAMSETDPRYLAYIPKPVTEKDCVNAVQKYMDTFARTRGYDNMMSACSYASSSIPSFASEGGYCLKMRDAIWQQCYTLLAQYKAGQTTISNAAELIALLPVLTWPAAPIGSTS